MTMLRSLSRLWAGWPLAAAPPARPGRGDGPEPENAERPFPATGAHWLDGWVAFGITDM
jgi:hypothetical protein